MRNDVDTVTALVNRWSARWVKLALTCGMSLIAIAVAHGQRIERWFDEPRSVSQGLVAIIEQCFCVITYEDPRYDESQVEDVTLKVRRDGRSTPRVFGPKAYPFAFAYDSTLSSTGRADVASVVRALLETANYSGTPRFLLDTTDSVLHVVPESGSILSARISIPLTETSALQFMPLFVAAVTEASGFPVRIGLVPTNYLAQSTIHVGASDEPAESVLVRALQEAGRKVYWRLFYDFGLKTYALNLSFAHPDRCLPSGRCDPGDTYNAVSLRGRGIRSGSDSSPASDASAPASTTSATPCEKCWIPLGVKGSGTPEAQKKK